MGKRSRKRRSEPAVAAKPPAERPVARPPRASRSEAKNEAVRSRLEPLAPGERPLVLKIGTAVAIAVVVANLAVYAAGWTFGGQRNTLVGFLLFAALMLTMAWGLWNARYWAVLGLEALLGILIVACFLFLTVAENVKTAVIMVAIIIPAGALFWFNVRVMARVQMPSRPQPRR